MITELLNIGRNNALSASYLAETLGINDRTFRHYVFRERVAGSLICASYSENGGGYYLAENKADVERYCKSIAHHESQLSQVRLSMLKAMEKLPE